MRKQIIFASIAGLASTAAAQSASLSIVASQTIVTPGHTTLITLEVYADADFGTHVTGAAITLNATGDTGIVESIAADGYSTSDWQALGFDDFGDDGNASHNGLVIGQVVFLPFIQPAPESALGNGPVFLGRYTVELAQHASSGTVTWTVGGGIGTFALEIIDVNANPGGNPPGEITQIASPEFGSVSVSLFPAPSSGAMIGFGALLVARRRR